MFIKSRKESKELKVYRYLNKRMELSEKDKNNYLNLEKGYAGEKKFDEWMESFSNDEILILNDLLLDRNNSVFQIDSLVITLRKTYLFEIKNFEDDFYIEGDKWYSLAGTEINNPISQLNRSELLLRGLLQSHGYNNPIESYVVFVNPTFFLYHAPRNPQLIFPTHLNQLKRKVMKSTGILNKRHSLLAQKLVSLHLNESPYTRLPQYNYNQLEKGITCFSCHSFIEILKTKESTIECKKCDHKERIDTAILRSTEEFKVLFPERKITTTEILEWCKGIRSKRFLRSILSKKYKLIVGGKSSYFSKAD